MKLIKLQCENCGGTLEVNSDKTEVICPYCDTKLLVDDEALHIKFDDMEKTSYDIEYGKLKAQNDAMRDQYELQKQMQKDYQKEYKKQKRAFNIKRFFLFLAEFWIVIVVLVYIIYKIYF